MQVNGFFKINRIWITFSLVALLLIYIFVNYSILAFSPQKELVSPLPTVERGSIVDRNGKPLAVQTNFYHFGVTPKLIKNPEEFASAISSTIEMSEEEIINKLQASKNSSFVYIKKKLNQTQYDDLCAIIKENSFSGINFDKIPGRVYPENTLASQLIGYMGDDGNGLSGIEYSQQSILSPALKDTDVGTIYGNNIYLTIDANLQYKLEKIASDAMKETQAESIMLVAANAKNGEILSYISLPSANLNDYPNSSTEEKIDRPAMTAYEPGSVFKIFTSAAYVDSGKVTSKDLFLCDGLYTNTTSKGETIKISCLEHHGWVSVREALQYSCNDALSQMSDTINSTTFLNYIRKFGFGERTEVELPAETRGSVKDQYDTLWSARSKPTMSIGQEISVSALQMVQAASALANGGIPLNLTFIQRITDKDGNVNYIHQPEYKERVIKKETANYILSCMETTAQKGTGAKASLGDISIGVKTGTAQMADPINGGYSKTDFLSNCMAIFPVEDPEIILYIVVEKAKGETYAGRIVAPVIAKAADEIIDHLGMNRARAASLEHNGKVFISESSSITIGNTVPNFIGRPKRDIIPLLTRTDINFKINGDGWITSQNPAPGTPVTENMTIELNLE